MSTPGGVAVLLSCHGTIADAADIPAFLHNIRRGRPAPKQMLAEVTRRFNLIGGSPLMHISNAQAQALQARLGLPVRVAARLWHPYPGQVLDELQHDGVGKVISLPLAPQSVHVYHAAVQSAAADRPIELSLAPAWGLEPKLVAAFAQAITEAWQRFPRGRRERVAIVLTAHSLPRRVIDAGDPYEHDFRAMADAVTEELRSRGLTDHTHVAFQSEGMDGGDWLGPCVSEVIQQLGARGVRDLLIAPIGFVADHVETLYDIDIEAVAQAKEHGIERVERMAAMNTREAFIDALEAVARQQLP